MRRRVRQRTDTSIAYDNVHYKDQPEAWNMRMVLGISTVLGILGVVAAFGLFYLGERVFHLDRGHVQTLMYLKMSVAGHLTIFLARTRGPFWSVRPARALWMAVLGTQIIATLIAVYGFLVTPLGWGWAAFVWGYALIWALLNDRVKLLAYRIFDPQKAGAEPKADAGAQPVAKAAPGVTASAAPAPDGKAAPQPDAKADSQPDVKVEPPREAKAEPARQAEPQPEVEGKSQPEVKAEEASDSTSQIAERAYALYEERGHQQGKQARDWKDAEAEIRHGQAAPQREIPQEKPEPEPHK